MRFTELFKNTNGKYSGSGFIGILSGIVSIIVLIVGVIEFILKTPESLILIDKGLMGLTIAAALLGIRKISKSDAEFKRE